MNLQKSNYFSWVLLLSVFSLLLFSCSNSVDKATPSNNQNVLGLVVQTQSSQTPSSVILLKDGRQIAPVSGFTPKPIVGSKFVLSFDLVQTSTNLISAKVTSYQAANSTPFSVTSSTSVSLSGTYTGSFTYSNLKDSSAYTTGATTLTLASDTYQATASTVQNGCLGGLGKYTAADSQITFTDASSWPSGTDMNRVLTGTFSYYATTTNLFIWKMSDDKQNIIFYYFPR